MTRQELFDELECNDIGFRIENPSNGRAVEIVDVPHERYQMSKGGMVAGLTNNIEVAINFLIF